MPHDKGDLIAGAVLAAFGTYVIWVAAKLPYVSDVGPGHGFFPLWLGIGLVVFAAALMFASFTSSVNKAKSSSWNSMIRPLAGWLAVMIAIALLGKIGFALSFIILTIFLVVALDRRSALLAVVVAVGLAVVFHLIFVVALDVSLPKTVWGF
jgi:putative tricarboxylic transport membrane protein